jgi:hypothetical protein
MMLKRGIQVCFFASAHRWAGRHAGTLAWLLNFKYRERSSSERQRHSGVPHVIDSFADTFLDVILLQVKCLLVRVKSLGKVFTTTSDHAAAHADPSPLKRKASVSWASKSSANLPTALASRPSTINMTRRRSTWANQVT